MGIVTKKYYLWHTNHPTQSQYLKLRDTRPTQQETNTAEHDTPPLGFSTYANHAVETYLYQYNNSPYNGSYNFGDISTQPAIFLSEIPLGVDGVITKVEYQHGCSKHRFAVDYYLDNLSTTKIARYTYGLMGGDGWYIYNDPDGGGNLTNVPALIEAVNVPSIPVTKATNILITIKSLYRGRTIVEAHDMWASRILALPAIIVTILTPPDGGTDVQPPNYDVGGDCCVKPHYTKLITPDKGYTKDCKTGLFENNSLLYGNEMTWSYGSDKTPPDKNDTTAENFFGKW